MTRSKGRWIETDTSVDPAKKTGYWDVIVSNDQITGTWSSLNGKKKLSIKLKRQKTVNGMAISSLYDDWNWRVQDQFYGSELKISLASEKGFAFEIHSYRTAHLGDVEGYAKWTSKRKAIERVCEKATCVFLSDSISDYEITFEFDQAKQLLISSRNTSFLVGMGVSFDGEYVHEKNVQIRDLIKELLGDESVAYCEAVGSYNCDQLNTYLYLNSEYSHPDFSNLKVVYGCLPGVCGYDWLLARDIHSLTKKPIYYVAERFFQDGQIRFYSSDESKTVPKWLLDWARMAADDELINVKRFVFLKNPSVGK